MEMKQSSKKLKMREQVSHKVLHTVKGIFYFDLTILGEYNLIIPYTVYDTKISKNQKTSKTCGKRYVAQFDQFDTCIKK